MEEEEEEIVDAAYVTSLLNSLFANIDNYNRKDKHTVADLYKLQGRILENLEELNQYEPAVLGKIYPDFFSKLSALNTNWIKIKDEYKEIPADLLLKTVENNSEKIIADENHSHEQVENYYRDLIDNSPLPAEIKTHCQNKLEEYESAYKGISSEVSGKPAVTFDEIKAPAEVMDLSWYKDGPLANFAKGEVENKIDEPHCTFKLKMNDSEPSLISVCDDIVKAEDGCVEITSPLNYGAMSAEERWGYINWLNNMTSECTKDFAKLFAMSIERYVFLQEEPDKAFAMLLKLRDMYSGDREWENYTAKLILICAIVNRRKDMVEKLMDLSTQRIPGYLLSAANVLDLPLSIDHIYNLASSVGFTNKRYLKLYPDMFTDILRQALYKSYSMEKFPLKKSYFSKDEWEEITCAENSSVEEAVLRLAKMEGSEEFKNTLCGFLKETHEKIKEILKEQRKNKSNRG